MVLRCCHVSLSRPGADKLLYLVRAWQNSSFEKGAQIVVGLGSISLKTSSSIGQWRAELNVVWKASQRLSVVIHRFPLYLMASVVGSFVNPIHQLPWATTLACHFSDLSVKECSFGVLYDSSEFFPTFQAPRYSIFINGLITLIVPPWFGVSCDS